MSAIRVSAREIRQNFANVAGEVAFGKKIAIITRNKNDMVAMISMDDLRRYKALEDYVDGLEAERVLKDMKGKRWIPFDEVLKKYGLSEDDL